MQDGELAIHTICQELDYLERYLASGGNIDPHDLQDLKTCHKQLDKILQGFRQAASKGWQEDSEPLPAWLQPEQTSSSSKHEEGEEPESAVAGHAYLPG
jgi:hypothetical protein